MLSTMSPNGMAISGQLQHHDYRCELDQCYVDGVLSIFNTLFRFPSCQQDPSSLLGCLFDSRNFADAGKNMNSSMASSFR